ncbi:MAG: hypothetical protein EXR58_00795 [Chloroflexi bacterium]|nr:hypothetical protein [Chloroflexota bacterium]
MNWDSISAAGLYLVFVGATLVLGSVVSRLPVLALIPASLVLLSLGLYLANLFSAGPLFALGFALIWTVGALRLLSRSFSGPGSGKRATVIGLLVAVSAAAVIAAPRFGPMVSVGLSAGQLQFIVATDEDKHLAILTSLVAGTGPIPFPFDPTVPFAYYYFFYLLPAEILKLVPHAHAQVVWFGHLLIAQVSFFCAALLVIDRITVKPWLRGLGFLLMLCGTSFKFVPKLMGWYGIRDDPHIEHWWFSPGASPLPEAGWQITHPVTLALWVPQHQFAATGVLLAALILLRGTPTWKESLAVGLILAAMLGASAFVAIAFVGALLLLGLTQIRDLQFGVRIGASLVTALVVSLPLLIGWGSNEAQIALKPYLPLAPGMPAPLGILWFYLVETGPLIPLLGTLIVVYLRQDRDLSRLFLILTLGTFVPLVLGRLFQSTSYNDVGMRTQVLFGLFGPLLLVFLLTRVRLARPALAATMLVAATGILAGAISGGLEIVYWFGRLDTHSAADSIVYQAVTAWTEPNDIVIINASNIADRLPLSSNRLTLEPLTPFSMDVYLPRDYHWQGPYSEALCSLYRKLGTTAVPYGRVYLELRRGPVLSCGALDADKQFATIVKATELFTLYRLPQW